MFDEWHFAAFVDNYLSGKYLFDIHPPFGKLTLSLAAKLGGYVNRNYTFNNLGQPYGDLVYYPQRVVSASVGSLIPSVMYLIARALGLDPLVSATVGAMPLLDMLLCIESRLILTDSQLVLYSQLALLCALYLWATPKSTPKRYMWLTLTAVFGACAVSTKWTAIVTPGLIALVSLTGAIFPLQGPLDLLEMAYAGALAIGIYMGTFWVHFRLLPLSGPGDAFMPIEFQQTLVGSEYYRQNDASKVAAPGFVENFRYLNWEMLRANSAIEMRHHWESAWHEWLYNARGILYIDEDAGSGNREMIYLISNPVLTVVSGCGVLFGLSLLLATPVILWRGRMSGALSAVRKRAGVVFVLVSGWVLNLVPYIGVRRCTFLYHVLPALQLASLLAGVALQTVPSRRVRTALCVAVVAAMAAAFWYWRAWTYALERSYDELKALRWMPRWN